MEIVRLPGEEAAVRRFLEDLWVPYNHELAAMVEDFALAEDVDVVSEELDRRLDLHESAGYRAWVAVDGARAADRLAEVDGEFAGFVTIGVDEAPTVFDRPDRLVVRDIYVREPYRGTGLAAELMERAEQQAREADCEQLKLKVDAANDRARAFYERLGFEPVRHEMVAEVD